MFSLEFPTIRGWCPSVLYSPQSLSDYPLPATLIDALILKAFLNIY